jgi:hypothetical protein
MRFSGGHCIIQCGDNCVPNDPENYAARAERCRLEASGVVQKAGNTRSTVAREQLLRVAQDWLLLAEAIEREGCGAPKY